MAWVRTKKLNERFRNTYRGWSIALSIVRPVEEDYGTSVSYAAGYGQALLDMCADGLISADDFEALEAAAQKRAEEKQGNKKTAVTGYKPPQSSDRRQETSNHE